MPRKCAYQTFKPNERENLCATGEEERAEKCIAFVMMNILLRVLWLWLSLLLLLVAVIIICDLNIRLEACKCRHTHQSSQWETLREGREIDRYSWCQEDAVSFAQNSYNFMLYHQNHHACNAPKYFYTKQKNASALCILLEKNSQFGFWSVAKTHFSLPSPTIAHAEDFKFSTFRMRMTRFPFFCGFILMKMEIVHDFQDHLIWNFGCGSPIDRKVSERERERKINYWNSMC